MIQGVKIVYRTGLRVHAQTLCKYSTTKEVSVKEEWRKRRNIIFQNELDRQRSEQGRYEKVNITYKPFDPEDKEIVMCMNKNLSTPFDVTKHLSQDINKNAALALVNGVPYDMQRPLSEDCEIKFLTMKMPSESSALNPTYWRTCSLILGAMIDSSFKDNIQLYLHSFPRPNVKSGSFVYDVVLDLPDWKPTDAELRAMSAAFVRLTNEELPLERLVVTEELALNMFQENPFKSKQIPDIAASTGMVTLYRIGDHVDVSRGPMVSHTGILGRSTVAAVHRVESDETDRLYRFQGISVPRCIYMNHYAYGILEKRARRVNHTAWMPQNIEVGNVQNIVLDDKKSSVAANN